MSNGAVSYRNEGRVPLMRLTVGAALAACLWAPAALAQQKVDERRPAAADAAVSVSNVAGSVTVTGWDRAEVAVTGTLEDGVERLEVTGGPQRIRIEVKLKQHQHDHGDATLEVKVPKGGSVDVDTVSADISAGGLRGALHAQSVSGKVVVNGSNAPIEAQSVSGDIEVTGAEGRLKATTVSGNVVTRGGTLSDVDLESVSGNLHCEASLAAKGTLDAKTVSGDVTISLPASLGADVSLNTFSGSLESAFDLGNVETSRFVPSKSVRRTIGDGGARLRVETLSGSIKLIKR
jgi:DUF4097 and DUF4098 domain-containing protein YvlB